MPTAKISPLRPQLSGQPHLTVEDIAQRWGCSIDTVRRHYREWGLRPLRFGKRLLFRADAVAEVEARVTGEAAE